MLHGTPWLKLITRWPAASVSDTSAAICLIKSGSAWREKRAITAVGGGHEVSDNGLTIECSGTCAGRWGSRHN